MLLFLVEILSLIIVLSKGLPMILQKHRVAILVVALLATLQVQPFIVRNKSGNKVTVGLAETRGGVPAYIYGEQQSISNNGEINIIPSMVMEYQKVPGVDKPSTKKLNYFVLSSDTAVPPIGRTDISLQDYAPAQLNSDMILELTPELNLVPVETKAPASSSSSSSSLPSAPGGPKAVEQRLDALERDFKELKAMVEKLTPA